jgi:hypothetical protein
VLAGTGAHARLERFLLAFGLAAACTISISAFVPALSPLVFYGIIPADYPNITLAVALEFVSQTAALREGSLRLVDLGGAQGLVTFPSFHTACGVLLLRFWGVPYVPWAGLLMNALLIVAVPIEGSHYLVDVPAGAVAAVAAWHIAGALRGAT